MFAPKGQCYSKHIRFGTSTKDSSKTRPNFKFTRSDSLAPKFRSPTFKRRELAAVIGIEPIVRAADCKSPLLKAQHTAGILEHAGRESPRAETHEACLVFSRFKMRDKHRLDLGGLPAIRLCVSAK